jgi:predicted acyltransferase
MSTASPPDRQAPQRAERDARAAGVGPVAPPARVASVDAYRGLVMFLMMAEVLELARVARAFPDSPVWQFLGWHQSHVEWVGCSIHDMIQPSFSFLVGVALPFSLARRLARGHSLGRAVAHAAWRALILVFLGVFLRSIGHPRTNFTFEDTLSQIGLGYLPLFLIALAPRPVRWVALAVILAGYWAAFALYPLPGPDFNWSLAGVSPDWPYNLTDFAAHWNKNTNPAWAFDTWFLNLFPREHPFTHNGGGYATLSFIPTLGTMLLGLIAGDWLQAPGAGWKKVARLVAAGAVCLAAGLAAHDLGICPIVKRIWTPAWVLYSGGWCFLILAGFYVVMDMVGFKVWGFPLRVIGMNSIAAYCLAHQPFAPFFREALRTHLGKEFFTQWGAAYETLALGGAVLAVEWLVLFWMYRRGIFLRI